MPASISPGTGEGDRMGCVTTAWLPSIHHFAAMSLEEYRQRFAGIHASRSRHHWTVSTHYYAPHKPLLLLSVMHLVAGGSIKSNLVEPSPLLGEMFNRYWQLVMPPKKRGNAVATVHFHNSPRLL